MNEAPPPISCDLTVKSWQSIFHDIRVCSRLRSSFFLQCQQERHKHRSVYWLCSWVTPTRTREHKVSGQRGPGPYYSSTQPMKLRSLRLYYRLIFSDELPAIDRGTSKFGVPPIRALSSLNSPFFGKGVRRGE